jgi:myosin heavy subunit
VHGAGRSASYVQSRGGSDDLSFTVRHYAQPVVYSAKRFLERNKHQLQGCCAHLLCASVLTIGARAWGDRGPY